MINCDDLESSESLSTAIIIVKRDPLQDLGILYTTTNHYCFYFSSPFQFDTWHACLSFIQCNFSISNCPDTFISSGKIIVREQHEFEDDGVLVILEWEELNPLYSFNITVTPETQVNISSGTARLTLAYNSIYNVTVMVSHFCDQSNEIIFSEMYNYPRGTAHIIQILVSA